MMTDSFMDFKKDFEQSWDQAVEDVNAIADAKDAANRLDCIERAENSVEQVERYLRILVNESRCGDAKEREEMQKAVRTYKTQVGKLKSRFKLSSTGASELSFCERIKERWREFRTS